MVEDVRLAMDGAVPVLFHGRTGGMVPSPDEVVAAARQAWSLTNPAAPDGPHAVPVGGER
jgi:2-oxoglutarate ferredoxin oxidoreductase subunit alpha